MGMPMGLKKATNYYNVLEAWKDFRTIYSKACRAGLGDKAILLFPADNAGWRTIDKSIAEIRKLLEENENHV
jgi:hypothetical protein